DYVYLPVGLIEVSEPIQAIEELVMHANRAGELFLFPLLFGILSAIFGRNAIKKSNPRSVRRPGNRLNRTLFQCRQCACFSAVKWDNVNLALGLVPVACKRNQLAVRRPARLAIAVAVAG